MNIEILKSGFESYILRTTGISSEQYLEQYSDESLWLNCAEFREYIETTYNADCAIFSGDINNISNMEVVDGELVLSEELEIIEQEKEYLEQAQTEELPFEEEIIEIEAIEQDAEIVEEITPEIQEEVSEEIIEDDK